MHESLEYGQRHRSHVFNTVLSVLSGLDPGQLQMLLCKIILDGLLIESCSMYYYKHAVFMIRTNVLQH